MSAKHDKAFHYDLLNLSLNAVLPQCELAPGDEIFPHLFRQVLPNFDKNVEFVLAEILALQLLESKTTTYVYSDSNAEDKKILIGNYLKIIKGFYEKQSWSLSKLTNFYFGQRIWGAQVRSTEAAFAPERQGGEKGWEKEEDTIPDLNAEDDEERREEEIENMLQEYIHNLYDLCLYRYPHSYILFIPVSLNSLTEQHSYKAKLGAIFLHFSSCEEVSGLELRRIYSRLLLFWHYYYTSESLAKREIEINQMKADKERYEDAFKYINEIQKIVQELKKPLQNLELSLSPVLGLIYGGGLLTDFFDTSGRPFQLNEKLAVKPVHDWNAEIARTPEGLKTYQDLTAAVLYKVLGLEDIVRSEPSLWQQLCQLMNMPAAGPKRLLINALGEYIPELKNETPTLEEIRNAFKAIKAWFHEAYKPKNKFDAKLPVSFLAMSLKAMNCRISFPIGDDEDLEFWVASTRPIDTIDALAVLDGMYSIEDATFKKTAKNTHLMEIRTKMPHNMDEDSLCKLHRIVTHTLRNYKEGDIPRKGNTTYVFMNLFGFKHMEKDEGGFHWSQDSYRLTVRFDGEENLKNKISMEWVGRVRQ